MLIVPDLKLATLYKLGDYIPEFKSDKVWAHCYEGKGLPVKGKRLRHKYEGRLKMKATQKKKDRIAQRLANVEMDCYDCARPLTRLPWLKKQPRLYVWTTPKNTKLLCSIGRFYAKRKAKLLEWCKENKIDITYRNENSVPVCTSCFLNRSNPDHRSFECRTHRRERNALRRSLRLLTARDIFMGVNFDDDFY